MERLETDHQEDKLNPIESKFNFFQLHLQLNVKFCYFENVLTFVELKLKHNFNHIQTQPRDRLKSLLIQSPGKKI